MKIMSCDTFWAKIYIAGPIDKIEQVCREWCMKGACVTVTPTNYIYTMGEESGVEVGLINYPRFPKSKEDIFEQAEELGHMLMEECCQGSFTIMTPDETLFCSRRRGDEVVK